MCSRGIALPLPLLQQHRIATLIHALHTSIRRRLAPALLTPALGADIRAPADSNAPRALITPGSPRPARTARDGEVVEPEARPRRDDANQAAKEDIESEMAVVHKSAGADVYRGPDGHEDQEKGPDGGRGVLEADGDDVVVVAVGQGGFLLGEGHGGFLLEVRGRNGRGVEGVC
jgi:hypothetical protein